MFCSFRDHYTQICWPCSASEAVIFYLSLSIYNFMSNFTHFLPQLDFTGDLHMLRAQSELGFYCWSSSDKYKTTAEVEFQ